ncbi:MAG: hypothetical protein JWP25_714 [Bradyrhizobium sp.]|nr:hypothetical protein [Bradyrhizobium sp.]
MSFETGHPALAFTAMDWNVAWSMPGILATTERCTEVMAKPLPSFDDDVRRATQLFRLEMGHFEHSNERHGKTRGMGCAKELFRIGARPLAVAAEIDVRIAIQRMALSRNRALAISQVAALGRRSETFHGSSS